MEEIFRENKIEKYGVVRAEELMPYFNNSATRRLGIEAKTVIPCLFAYKPKDIPKRRNLSIYSIIPDYHILILDKLNAVCERLHAKYGYSFKAYVDISPIDEVKAGFMAGLGNIGMNGMLINKDYGAMHFIGAIMTDMEIEPFSMRGEEGCVNCRNCIKNCPNGALSAEGVDQSRCLSAITQKKGELSLEEQRLIFENKLVWGCDNCSVACPIEVKCSELSNDVEAYVTEQNLDRLIVNRAFSWRGRKVMERNIRIVAGEIV